MYIIYLFQNKYSNFIPYKSNLPGLNLNKNIAIIFPYRDQKEQKREEQLNNILSYYKNINNPNIDIFIIEQANDKLFNKGTLLNIGHKIISSKNKYQNEIHHDIDMLPDNERIKYFFNDNVIACKINNKKYNGSSNFVGGILSIPLNIMDQINGYSNNFWGWGREDDNLYKRLYAQQIKIYRPNKGNVTEIEHIKANKLYINDNFKNNYDNNSITHRNELKNGFNSGLSDLSYDIINKEIIANNIIKYSVTF